MKAYVKEMWNTEKVDVFKEPRQALQAYLDEIKKQGEEPDSTLSLAVIKDSDKGDYWFAVSGEDIYTNWCELDEVDFADYFDKDRIISDFDSNDWTQLDTDLYED